MSTAITATIDTLHRLIAAFNGIDLSDDRGVEDSPAKMIWIAAAIIIAGLAVAFAITVFNDAKDNVPSPAVPRRLTLFVLPARERVTPTVEPGRPGWRRGAGAAGRRRATRSCARSSVGQVVASVLAASTGLTTVATSPVSRSCSRPSS